MNDNKPSMYDLFNDDSLWGNQTAGGLTNEEILYKNWNLVRTAEQNKKIGERISKSLTGKIQPSNVIEKKTSTRLQREAEAKANGEVYGSIHLKGRPNEAARKALTGRMKSADVVAKGISTRKQREAEAKANGEVYGSDKNKNKQQPEESIKKRELNKAQKRAEAAANGESYGSNSPEAIAKRVATRAQRKAEAKARGEAFGGDKLRGRKKPPMTDAQRKKISEAKKGKKWSPESIAKRTETCRRNREAKLAAQALTQTE